MEVVYERCAGLDVHKKSVTACRIIPAAGRGWQKERQRFGTMTDELLKLARIDLATYKVPRRLFVIDQLPRNPSGKILKTQLRPIT